MAGTDLISGGNIEPRGLEEEMRSAYLDYAMSVIVGRAPPDVRDGLKPVHRRVLFSMSENGLQPNRPYSKCARIVGDVRSAQTAAGRGEETVHLFGDLVVFHGSSTVDGTVNGSLTAFDAPVTISGRVNGDVVVFNGRVELQSGANVTGDVVSQNDPVVASGATIGGTSSAASRNGIRISAM